MLVREFALNDKLMSASDLERKKSSLESMLVEFQETTEKFLKDLIKIAKKGQMRAEHLITSMNFNHFYLSELSEFS